jgi:hypothetical protein
VAVALKFEFAGDVQLDRTLARFEAADDARPAWEALARKFAAMERRQFSTEGAYGSGGWPDLSDKYAAWKERHYPGKTILRRSDELYKSLTERPFGVEVIEPGFMVLGTDVRSEDGFPYAEAHQQGTGRLPQRRPIEFRESDRAEWVKVLQRFIVTGKATP